MMEQILTILRQVPSEYFRDALGVLIIIYLLLIALRIRKKKRISKTGLQESPPTSDLEAAGHELPDEAAAEVEQDFDEEIGESVETLEPEAEEPIAAEQEFGPEPEDLKVPEKEGFKVEVAVEATKPEPEKIEEKPKPTVSVFDRLKTGLSKTRQGLAKRFDSILSGNRKIDDNVLEEIEEILITSDVGVATTMELMQRISKNAARIQNADDFKSQLKSEMLSFVDLPQPENTTARPHVIMIVGVNGVGKTTTIGKLASKYIAQGKKVLLSASDTFRAAAVEQLQIWADRAGADIVKHRDNADPAAVAFDSVEAALSRDMDIVIVDTAGRIQTKVNLMEQLKKIKRSIAKKIPDAPHEVLLVLDATTGQNAISQAKLFHEGIGITGIVLAKLDGTAKGGIVAGICHTLNIPIRYVGIGEGVEDLQEFDPKLFIDALL